MERGSGKKYGRSDETSSYADPTVVGVYVRSFTTIEKVLERRLALVGSSTVCNMIGDKFMFNELSNKSLKALTICTSDTFHKSFCQRLLQKPIPDQIDPLKIEIQRYPRDSKL